MSRLASVSITHALVPHERYKQLLDIEQRLAAAEARSSGMALLAEQYRKAFVKHRTSTHLVAPKACRTCQESDALLAMPPDDAASALWAAAQGMASDLDTLMAGGIDMMPSASGPVTFEALVMLIQTMAANRDAWRRAAAAGGAVGDSKP